MTYSCVQDNIRESSKSCDQRKINKKLKVTKILIDNAVCKYLDTNIHIEDNLKDKT